MSILTPLEASFCHQLVFSVSKNMCKFHYFRNYNPILELYKVLVHVRFATSKRVLDIQYKKLIDKLPHKLLNDLRLKDLRKLGSVTLAANLSTRFKTLKIAFKKYAIADIQIFQLSPISLDFFTLFQIPCPGLQMIAIVRFNMSHVTNFLHNFWNFSFFDLHNVFSRFLNYCKSKKFRV